MRCGAVYRIFQQSGHKNCEEARLILVHDNLLFFIIDLVAKSLDNFAETLTPCSYEFF